MAGLKSCTHERLPADEEITGLFYRGKSAISFPCSRILSHHFHTLVLTKIGCQVLYRATSGRFCQQLETLTWPFSILDLIDQPL